MDLKFKLKYAFEQSVSGGEIFIPIGGHAYCGKISVCREEPTREVEESVTIVIDPPVGDTIIMKYYGKEANNLAYETIRALGWQDRG